MILKKLSSEIIDRGLDIRWFTFARMEKGFDYETCKLLFDAGCRILMFGFESAVQRIVDLMQKGTKVGSCCSNPEGMSRLRHFHTSGCSYWISDRNIVRIRADARFPAEEP